VAIADAPVAAPARRVRAWDFVRLKLRLMGNGFRGQAWRVVAFVFGLLFGLVIAGLAVLGLAASSAAPLEVGYIVAAYTGGIVVLGWTLVPLLFFGVDETLDPARFALLPIRRATLTRGMLAAAFIGVPALATLIATSGLAVSAGIRFGLLGVVTGLAGVVAGLVLGVVASRAVTSAFASLLRSRRVRDLAAVLIALLATSIGPLQWAILAAVANGTMELALKIANVIAWTPFGAPYVIAFDIASGRWDLAAARAGITVATILLLFWWWSRTIESAMLATSSNGSARARKAGAGGGAVRALIPGPIRAMTRPGPFSAIMAREARFWWRDGRRRAALVSILMASAVLPVALTFSSTVDAGRSPSVTGLSGAGFSFAVSMAGTMGGLLLGNQFGYDGSAYAAHLLSRVRGRTELLARAAAVAVTAVPVQVAVAVAVAALSGRIAQLPAGLGVLAASFGAAVACSSILSVFAAYPLPENTNPFAMNTGGGTAKGMLALLAFIGTLIVSMPIAVPALLWGASAGGAAFILVAGVAYGLGMAWLGTYIAGDVLDRRGPEILAAVTPKR
jgi:ABC-2 type transport system permease protein